MFVSLTPPPPPTNINPEQSALPLRPLKATTTRTPTATTTTRASSSNDDNGETSSSSSAAAANVVAANPLFASNPAFAAVLADSLSRQGSGALVSGEERTPEDELDKEGPIEEVLASCLRDQRQAVVQLEQMEKVVKAALERERKQFERLQFAFKKAANDRAYAQSLAKLRKRFVCVFCCWFFEGREESGGERRESRAERKEREKEKSKNRHQLTSRFRLLLHPHTTNNTGTRKSGPRWRRS